MGHRFDKTILLEKVYGDKDLLTELLDMFLEMSPSMLDSIDHAIHSRDTKKLSEVAHTLKGSVGHFSVEGPFNTANQLENMAKSNDLSQAPDTFEILKKELEILNQELKDLRHEINS
jgi:HPt (histidine-containing phosphotransfer) domain-containing protein